ncbi:M81 family metallopeptidase [Dankookia sp. P2]|uniref:M81 family metallopeptidase n=1 Tax=Dankookia sp. P2 TaxID=3423955 RepID=UPI003D67371E
MRIAIGGFQHESHSFAPLPTGWREFLQPGGFPGLQRPSTLVETLRPTSVPCAGAIEVLDAAGATIVLLTWCFANPAGLGDGGSLRADRGAAGGRLVGRAAGGAARRHLPPSCTAPRWRWALTMRRASCCAGSARRGRARPAGHRQP